MATATVTAAPNTERDELPWYRRPWLYLALGLLVGILAVLWSSQRAEEGIRANLDARLLAAGAGVDAAMVGLESDQLTALRAITFSTGMSQALATTDVAEINRIAAPLQANSGIPMVDILRPDGRVILAVRSKGAPAPVANRSNLPGLKQALREARGSRGGRFAELVIFASGPTLVTLGPVMNGTTPVGVVLVMTPLADALGRFSQEVGADLSVYDAAGNPIATTASYIPPSLSTATAAMLLGGGAVITREFNHGHREAIGRLILDHQAVGVLGVTLIDNAPTTGRAVALYAALGLIGTVAVIVAFVVRQRALNRDPEPRELADPAQTTEPV